MNEGDELYALMAEFEDEHSFLEAVRRVVDAGYTEMDAYSPFPVEGAAEAMNLRRTGVPPLTLIGGILGLVGGFSLQYWVAVIAYPLDIGGRPLNSWPYFVPISYEMTILFASWITLLGMLALNGLPRPHHPVFNVPAFARASQDRFFVVIEASDPKFSYEGTRRFFEDMGVRGLYDVPS